MKKNTNMVWKKNELYVDGTVFGYVRQVTDDDYGVIEGAYEWKTYGSTNGQGETTSLELAKTRLEMYAETV